MKQYRFASKYQVLSALLFVGLMTEPYFRPMERLLAWCLGAPGYQGYREASMPEVNEKTGIGGKGLGNARQEDFPDALSHLDDFRTYNEAKLQESIGEMLRNPNEPNGIYRLNRHAPER